MSSTSGDIRTALGTCRRALEIARDRGAAKVEVVDVQSNKKSAHICYTTTNTVN